MFGQKEEENQGIMPERPGTSTQSTAQDISASNAKLLTVSGDYAKIEGTFEIADSLEVECEIGGELNVRGKLVIGQQGVVTANVRTVDAVVKGSYEGNMVATGNVEIAATGRVMGNITTDSLVISKGGFFNGNVTRIDEKDKQKGPSLMAEDRRAASSSLAASGSGLGAKPAGGSDEDEDEDEDKDESKGEERLVDRDRSTQSSRSS